MKAVLAFVLVLSAFDLANAARTTTGLPQTFECELVTRPPADENYSPEFFNTKIEMADALKVSMNVGELDVFGSCGKANIGKFDTSADKYTEDSKTGAVSFEREFISPIHIDVPMWEKMTISLISETILPTGKTQMKVNIKYDHSCQKYIDYDVELNCTEQ